MAKEAAQPAESAEYQPRGDSELDTLAAALMRAGSVPEGGQPADALPSPRIARVPETAVRPPAAPELRGPTRPEPPTQAKPPAPQPAATPPAPAREEPAQEAEEAEEEEAQEAEGAEEEVEGEEVEGEDPVVEVVVDGQTREVPFSQILASYQQQASLTQRSMELAQAERAFEAQINEVAQRSAAQQQEVSRLIEGLTYELNRTQPTAEQWEMLRKEDPGEYAARRQDWENRQRVLQAARYQQQQIQQRQITERVPQERAALAALVPEFQKDFDGTYRRLGKWVVGEGFLRPEEWDQIIDHRHVHLIWKAYKAETSAQATRKRVPQVTRKLAKTPKVIRPGQHVEPGQAEREEYNAIVSRPLNTQKDVQAAFFARQKLRSTQGA